MKFQNRSRQVFRAHFSEVLPEKVPSPQLLCFSRRCAEDLGLSANEAERELFTQIFSGNYDYSLGNLSSISQPYATVYGCHSFGYWFGQLGDGRACTLGEIHTICSNPTTGDQKEGQKYVLQLKGSGRTPYSRHGDGRAVLRSC